MLKLWIVLALTVLPGAALAQSSSVPEKMPFDIPYGLPIALDQAKHLVGLAEAEAKKHGWKMNIAVVGPAGELISFEKMDGAQLASIAIAQHKAKAAATFRRETRLLQQAIDGGHPSLMTLDGVIGSEGGFPLVENGKLIGAIGCSGGTGQQDGVTCKAAAETMK